MTTAFVTATSTLRAAPTVRRTGWESHARFRASTGYRRRWTRESVFVTLRCVGRARIAIVSAQEMANAPMQVSASAPRAFGAIRATGRAAPELLSTAPGMDRVIQRSSFASVILAGVALTATTLTVLEPPIAHLNTALAIAIVTRCRFHSARTVPRVQWANRATCNASTATRFRWTRVTANAILALKVLRATLNAATLAFAAARQGGRMKRVTAGSWTAPIIVL
jgi:hypothetical protein